MIARINVYLPLLTSYIAKKQYSTCLRPFQHVIGQFITSCDLHGPSASNLHVYVVQDAFYSVPNRNNSYEYLSLSCLVTNSLPACHLQDQRQMVDLRGRSQSRPPLDSPVEDPVGQKAKRFGLQQIPKPKPSLQTLPSFHPTWKMPRKRMRPWRLKIWSNPI